MNPATRAVVWTAMVTAVTVGDAGGTARADTAINFFGDVDYYVAHTGSGMTNSFQAPEVDLFATQTEGKFQFVAEILVEAFGQNEFSVDVDRLEVDYRPASWLRFRAGRLRSAFGYYGDAYQNGMFFMLAATWPQMYQGNGYDGIVPSHAVGVHADASHELGDQDGKLAADVEVLNGRGQDLDTVTSFADDSNDKGVDVRVRYIGEDALDGLVLGANAYYDDIPFDARPGSENPAMHELVLGGHAVYVTDRVHLIAEGAWFHHREYGTQTVHTTLAAFGEAGYAFGDYTPFARYEYTHFSSPDPYFLASGIPGVDHHLVIAGVKYAASASVAFKLQTSMDFYPTETDYRALAQAAFAF